MSKPPKLDRKLLKAPDEFVTKGKKFLDVLVGQKLRVEFVLGAVAVVVLGVYAYDWWDGKQSQKVWDDYYLASKAPEPEKWDKFKAVGDSRGKTRAGFLASVSVADHAFDEAKKEVMKDPAANSAQAATAVEWYSKALTFKGLSQMEKQLLWINRGNSQEIAKKWDEAAADYKLAADAGGSAKALALLGTARIFELKGDTVKAAETYEQIAGEFAANEYGKTARNHVRRLKGALLSGHKTS